MGNDFIAVDGVVSCPKCGARNRIGTYAITLRPVCGNCKMPLDTAVNSCAPKQPPIHTYRSRRSRSKRNRTWVAYLMLALIIGMAVAIYVTFMTSSPPSAPPEPSSSSHYGPAVHFPLRTREHPATPAQNRRLPNGTILRNAPLTGNGNLTVINGLDGDAVAKLINRENSSCQAFFYVAANSTYTLPGVPDGKYRLLFGTGSDWDDTIGFFTQKRACSEFTQPMDFETTTKSERQGLDTYLVTYFSENSITLHPVPDGNARTHNVSESEFQKY